MADRAEFILRLIDKVTGPGKKIDRALGRTQHELTKVDRVAGRSNRSMTGFGRTSDRIRSGGGLFGGATMDVLKGNLLTIGATKVAELGAATIRTAGEFVMFGEKSRIAFQSLAKHGADPAQLFEHSRALAKRFGLDVLDTTKAYQKFLALQFDPKGADTLIKMGADLRVLGASADEVKGVFTALGQIKSKKVLQAEELMQLAERGISTGLVVEEIGKLMGGISDKEVRKLQRQGEITADVGLKAIEAAINRKLGQSKVGESGARFADTTIEGVFGRVKALAQDTGLNIADRITAPLNKLAIAGLDKVESFLMSPQGQRTIDAIGAGVERLVKWGIEFGKAFGEGFGETFEAISSGFRTMGSAFGDSKATEWTPVIKALGRGLGQLGAITVATMGTFTMLAGGMVVLGTTAWNVGKAVVAGIMDPITSILGRVVLWWDDLTAIWDAKGLSLGEKALEIGRHVVTGLWNGIKSLASLPVDAVTSIGSNVVDAIKGVFATGSPSKVTRAIGGDVTGGLAIGITNMGEAAVRAARIVANDTTVALAPTGTDGVAVPDMATPTMRGGVAASMGGAVGGARVVVHLNQVNHFDGSSSSREIAQEVSRSTRREMESFFRQISDEV